MLHLLARRKNLPKDKDLYQEETCLIFCQNTRYFVRVFLVLLRSFVLIMQRYIQEEARVKTDGIAKF